MKVLEIHPVSTIVDQPHEAGSTGSVKRLYKTRLFHHVVAYLHKVITWRRSHPRAPPDGGLDQGGQEHLLDAVEVNLNCLEQNSAEQLAS